MIQNSDIFVDDASVATLSPDTDVTLTHPDTIEDTDAYIGYGNYQDDTGVVPDPNGSFQTIKLNDLSVVL